MTMFKAAVQYGDYKGSSAADDADGDADLRTFLTKKGLMKEEEFLLGSTLWIGENRAGKLGHVGIQALLFNSPDHATVTAALEAIEGPVPVRAVTLEVSLDEYLCFFKRFAVTITRKGFDLNEREFTVIE